MEQLTLNQETLRSVCGRMTEALPHSVLRGEVLAGLESYLSLVVKWNKAMNLVGPSYWEEVLTTLVADSFYLARFLESLPLPESPECWDLGAGAGLPGIPLRLVWQKGVYTLVEAREKRALFLQTVLAACSLPGVSVFRGRAEVFMPKRPSADLVVSRAFLPWEKVLELVAPYMSPGGMAVFLTLVPVPQMLPKPWTAVAETRYLVAEDTRYLWALRSDTSL